MPLLAPEAPQQSSELLPPIPPQHENISEQEPIKSEDVFKELNQLLS